MVREVKFSPAFDKRNPDPKKSFGVYGMDIVFLLTGADGVVDFRFNTGIYLPEVQLENKAKGFTHEAYGVNVGWHSPKPLYDWQQTEEPSTTDCDYLNRQPCWCDGSTLRAQEWLEILIRGGEEPIWKMLEEYYVHVFGGNL